MTFTSYGSLQEVKQTASSLGCTKLKLPLNMQLNVLKRSPGLLEGLVGLK